MPMLKQHAIHGISPFLLLRKINLSDFLMKRPRQWFLNLHINKKQSKQTKNNLSMVMVQPCSQHSGS